MMLKKMILFIVSISVLWGTNSSRVMGGDKLKLNKLDAKEQYVILKKGTERPFAGIYVDHKEEGEYLCKQCDTPLYRSNDKFDSQCGWPSFDDEIPGRISRVQDKDGIRTEIVCANCGGHLGHVFEGEGFTDKNVRHCVNSISLNFKPNKEKSMEHVAYFAGGCFWGTEFLFQKLDGVLDTRVGYMGGDSEKPTYEEVCSGKSGHYEALKIKYNPDKIDFHTLTRYFFEIHDPTQEDGQGPDIGEQYKSAIFYVDEEQKKTAQQLITLLEKKGYQIATALLNSKKFWEAEEYHQDYYKKTGKFPYCHAYIKRF